MNEDKLAAYVTETGSCILPLTVYFCQCYASIKSSSPFSYFAHTHTHSTIRIKTENFDNPRHVVDRE